MYPCATRPLRKAITAVSAGSGDPLSVFTHVLETWVEGTKVFDRSNPKDKLYAVGGYGASHDASYPTEVVEY